MKRGKIIALAGVPATGKTTVGKAIAEKYNVSFLEEDWREIIFFAKERNSSNFEFAIGFLNLRFSQITKADKLASEGKNVLLDTFFEMSEIYSKMTLPTDEFFEFKKVFDVYSSNLPKVDKYIHFTGDLPTIRERALARKLGIEMENQMIGMNNLKDAEKNICKLLSIKDQKNVMIIDVTKNDIRTEIFLEDFYRKVVFN